MLGDSGGEITQCVRVVGWTVRHELRDETDGKRSRLHNKLRDGTLMSGLDGTILMTQGPCFGPFTAVPRDFEKQVIASAQLSIHQ